MTNTTDLNMANALEIPWVLTDKGNVSVYEALNCEKNSLVGTSYEVMSQLRLLLSMAQAAWTPENHEELCTGGSKKLLSNMKEYLE